MFIDNVNSYYYHLFACCMTTSLHLPEGQISKSMTSEVKHSRLKNQPFSWQKACDRALKHKLTNAIHLARTNIDYQIKYPNECRDNPEHKILKECHHEAFKRIMKDHEKMLVNTMTPVVIRPKRLSKNVK